MPPDLHCSHSCVSGRSNRSAGLLAHSGGTDQLLAEEVDRASGGFATANYLGFFAAQYTLLGIGVWPLVARRYQPLLAVVIATTVAALVVSYSRSAYVGTAAGIVVLVALRSPRQALLLVAIAAVAGVALYPLFLEARVNGAALDPTVIFQRAQSENWRSLAAAAGISMFLAQPVFGVGFGVFQHLSPRTSVGVRRPRHMTRTSRSSPSRASSG